MFKNLEDTDIKKLKLQERLQPIMSFLPISQQTTIIYIPHLCIVTKGIVLFLPI